MSVRSFFDMVRKLSLSIGSPDFRYFFLASSLAMKAVSRSLFHQDFVEWAGLALLETLSLAVLLISSLSLFTQRSMSSAQEKVVWLRDKQKEFSLGRRRCRKSSLSTYLVQLWLSVTVRFLVPWNVREKEVALWSEPNMSSSRISQACSLFARLAEQKVASIKEKPDWDSKVGIHVRVLV